MSRNDIDCFNSQFHPKQLMPFLLIDCYQVWHAAEEDVLVQFVPWLSLVRETLPSSADSTQTEKKILSVDVRSAPPNESEKCAGNFGSRKSCWFSWQEMLTYQVYLQSLSHPFVWKRKVQNGIHLQWKNWNYFIFHRSYWGYFPDWRRLILRTPLRSLFFLALMFFTEAYVPYRDIVKRSKQFTL
jgi:hypothetical protein